VVIESPRILEESVKSTRSCLADMSAPKISAMENEPRNLTIGTLIRAAHALGCPSMLPSFLPSEFLRVNRASSLNRVEIKLVRRKGTKLGWGKSQNPQLKTEASAPDDSVFIEVVRHQPLNLVRCDRIHPHIKVDHISS
jgi:hypothetical protein